VGRVQIRHTSRSGKSLWVQELEVTYDYYKETKANPKLLFGEVKANGDIKLVPY